jgi:hypothetical protein
MLSLPEPIHELAWYFAVRDFAAAEESQLDASPGTRDRAEAYLAVRRAVTSWDAAEAAYARDKITLTEEPSQCPR